MYLESLALDHFRNYERLRAGFEAGVVVLQGENAQGKTNLLEAVYMLATTKSSRARTDAELISWQASAAANPLAPHTFARIEARVRRAAGAADVQILIRDTPALISASDDDEGLLPTPPAKLPKRFKLNGVVRRAGEMLGQVTAVFFAPTDVEIVSGSPHLRRRYLDITLCQLSQSYYRALQTYNRAISQRNALLRQVRDGRQPLETLDYWDELLLDNGAHLIEQRHHAVTALSREAAATHTRLSGGREALQVVYRPALGDAAAVLTTADGPPVGLRAAFAAEMARVRRREIAQGVSLLGPHRDDLCFLANDVDMTSYGSRGQQRTVALAIKMAELDFMRSASGEGPILLLDDATSELDEVRRRAILDLARREEQVFITTADPAHLAPLLSSGAQRYSVSNGHLALLTRSEALYELAEAPERRVAEPPAIPLS